MRYDTTRNEPFLPFAEKRIRGAVLDELRRGDMMPRRVRTSARNLGQTIRRLEHTLGRAPEDHEIADALGVTLDDYRENLEQLAHVSFVDMGDAQQEMDAKVGPSSEKGPLELFEQAEMAGRIKEALTRLPERSTFATLSPSRTSIACSV